MKKDTDIPVLHSLRALAALSVCLFHFVCTVNGFIDKNIIKDISSFGHYGVQMFFVISGFIIPWSMFHSSYSTNNYLTFALKRFIRLEPPYIISLLFAIAHTYVRTLSPHFNGIDTTPTTKQIVLHFGYLIPFFEGQTWIRQVYWTLAIEFQYYLSIGLLFSVLVNKKIIYRLISYVIILSGPFLVKEFLLFHFPVFLLGIAVFLYKSKIIFYKELIILSVVTALEIIIFHGIGTLVFASITYFAILFFADFKNKTLDFFGDISYSIYLFHSLTGLVLINYFSHTVNHPVAKTVLVITAFAITTIASYVVYRLIELPSKRFSSKIKFKQNI